MKTRIKSSALSLLVLVSSISLVFAQEYDDMYFSSKDREVKEQKTTKKNAEIAKIEEASTDLDESFSEKNVNPEYIAKYRADQEQNTSGNQFEEDEYFNEDYREDQVVNNFQNNADVVIQDRFGNTTYFRDARDVYWSDPLFYRGTVFDPFYSPFGFNRFGPGLTVNVGFGFGWNRWNRWNRFNSWNVGFGYGWGNRWGYDPWFGGAGFGFYDPWFYDPFFCPTPFRNNVVVINNYESRANRTIRRGVAPSRTAVAGRTGTSRSSRVVSSSTSNGRSSSRVASNSTRSSRESGRSAYSSSRRSADGGQSRYYRRSRGNDESSVSSRSSRSSRSYTSNSRNSSSSSNYSRSSRSTAPGSRSGYSRSGNSRSSGYNRSSSRSRSSGYNRSSGSRSGSFYSRPSSGSRSSGSRSYSGSRSSGSRSSGVSRSSGGSSRSSGSRSSSSRSSGRRGN
ncbi:MAG: hypothetical protein ACFB2Y_19455 [Fulvivirga sp.]